VQLQPSRPELGPERDEAVSRALLINPSYAGSYGAAKAALTYPVYPTLGLTTIAAEALSRGHAVDILDLSYRPYDWDLVRSTIRALKPDIVGVTATTPLMNQLRDISVLCKDISRDILVVGGGAHISALPGESMNESRLDLALAGESDRTFGEICDGRDPRTVPGLYYRDGAGNIVHTGPRPLVENLDDLPMPAWHLYDPGEYRNKISRILVRRRPATITEFSRGCVFKCDFCASKMTMGLGYRKKSPERCAEEVAVMARLGWREFMLADDIFTSDSDWAIRVSEAIIRKGAGIAWTCNNGIRVESADDRLFATMRRAGCYRVSFGFESGNDQVLKAFGKGGRASLEQGRVAVGTARAAGVETNGFFLLGLSADTEDTMRETIAFARSLELDILKFGITLPLPGTPMFHRYAAENRIRSFEWDDYHVHSAKPLFSHHALDHDTVQRYMKLAYRRAIAANPAFILRRIKRGVRTGEFVWDAFYFLKFLARPAVVDEGGRHHYYARDRWPRHDFGSRPPVVVGYQKAVKNLRATSAMA
jgi:anaerobic magnesium-protoporphyrin IX monomethyl ester cyclase